MNDGFRFEDIVEETTNKIVKHVGRETIQVKQFPNDLKLDMKVFIGGTKVENSMK